MEQSNTLGARWLAGAAGAIFLAGTAGILFEDVLLQGHAFALKHGITTVTILGTMLVGHLAHEAWRGRKWGSSFWFSFLFVVGTALVVYSSVGRQGEALAVTQAQADASADARATAKRGLARAEAMLAEAQAELGRECKTGRGKRCDGIKATVDVYSAAAGHHQAELDRIGPARPVAIEAEKFAEAAAAFGADQSKMKAAAILFQPLGLALFLEFGAIVSFGFAFRGDKKTIATTISGNAIDWNDLPSPSMFSGDLPEPPKPRKKKRLPETNVITFRSKHPVIDALERNGGSVASNIELAALMNCCPPESSKRVQEVMDRLAIQRVGKEKRIALR